MVPCALKVVILLRARATALLERPWVAPSAPFPIIPPPDNGCRRIIFTSFLIRIPCPCARCLTDRQAKWQCGRMSCKRTERVRWKSLLPLIDIHHFTFNGIMLWGDIGLGRIFFSLAPCLSQHGIMPAS